MQKKVCREVTTSKITKSEATKLFDELIQKDIDALEREKSNDIRKYNILDIIINVGSVFTGAYLHYKDVPKETMFERSIAERTILRRGRSDEIKKQYRT